MHVLFPPCDTLRTGSSFQCCTIIRQRDREDHISRLLQRVIRSTLLATLIEENVNTTMLAIRAGSALLRYSITYVVGIQWFQRLATYMTLLGK